MFPCLAWKQSFEVCCFLVFVSFLISIVTQLVCHCSIGLPRHMNVALPCLFPSHQAVVYLNVYLLPA